MLDWLRVGSGAIGMSGGNCRRYQNRIVQSDHVFVVMENIALITVVEHVVQYPILIDCCYTIYCNCSSAAAVVVTDGVTADTME